MSRPDKTTLRRISDVAHHLEQIEPRLPVELQGIVQESVQMLRDSLGELDPGVIEEADRG